MESTCKFCQKKFSKGQSLGAHTVTCPQNPKRRRTWKLPKFSEERKANLSNRMIQVAASKPGSYSMGGYNRGRIKPISYRGEILHGRWEVIFAQWLDSNSVVWRRPKIPFKYEFQGKTRSYFPDFYLPDLNLYVEVKGYETDRDRQKWSSVPNLLVIKAHEIEQIKSGKFSVGLLHKGNAQSS